MIHAQSWEEWQHEPLDLAQTAGLCQANCDTECGLLQGHTSGHFIHNV